MDKECSRCNLVLPLSRFLIYNDTKRGKRVKAECKNCSRIRLNKWTASNRQHVNDKSRDRTKGNKIKAIEYKGGVCEICNGNYHPAAFDFHHIETKDSEISKLLSRKWENIMPEVEKCKLLCSNCHRTLHAMEGY